MTQPQKESSLTENKELIELQESVAGTLYESQIACVKNALRERVGALTVQQAKKNLHDGEQLCRITNKDYHVQWPKRQMRDFLREHSHGGVLASCTYDVTAKQIQPLAEKIWQARVAMRREDDAGNVNTARQQEDWFEAERQLKAEQQSFPVGGAIYEIREDEVGDRVLRIDRLVVEKDLRRSSDAHIGSRILEKIQSMRVSCAAVEIFVSPGDEIGQEFLRAHGFKTARFLRRYFKTFDGVLMRRPKGKKK